MYFVLISKLNVKINNDDNNDDIYTAHKWQPVPRILNNKQKYFNILSFIHSSFGRMLQYIGCGPTALSVLFF